MSTSTLSNFVTNLVSKITQVVSPTVAMACPTEDFLENLTGLSIGQIKTLNLEDMKFKFIYASIFNKMTNLTVLNLSQNDLTSIPDDLHLPKLRELDISDNNIKSLLFTRNLPALVDMYTDGNGLEADEKYKVATLCPNLMTLNKYSVDSLRKVVSNVREQLWPQVQELWSASLAGKYSGGIPQEDQQSALEEFSKVISKATFLAPVTLKKYTVFVAQQLATELLKSVSCGKYETPRKKRRHETMPGTPGSPRFTAIKRKGLVSTLPAVDDYEPAHFIRCHAGDSKEHGDNDPTDNMTQVWRAVFEPNPHKPGEFTNIVATVGGHNVCLIDCNSGKIMKRYKETGETFFTVAWTTIQMTQGDREWPTNILAAAGVCGCVRLLHPDQLVCYHEFDVGGKRRPDYINAALFHPTRTTHLYCGDSNGNITAWDIGIPSGAEYKTKVTSLFTLQSRTDAVTNLFCDKNDRLIAGCEGALLMWNINQNVPRKTREADAELVLPGKNETNVDGLTSIGEDLIATKVTGEGCIYLWRISSVLDGKKKHTIKINPMAVLEWLETKTMYVNLGASKEGMLACGDDRGQVWLYNVSRLLKSVVQPDELLRPSRILPWPVCETHNKRDMESLMIDLLEQDPKERIVNHVNVSQNNEYVVACTADNMVCIWRRPQ